MLAGLGGDEPERAPERRVEDVTHERRLARAADARDDAHAPDRHAKVDVAQVVRARAGELDPRVGHRALRPLDARRLLQRARRGGARIREHLRRRSLGHDVAAVATAPGTEIDHVVGGADRLGVVLDDEHRRAHVRELPQVREQAARVARVQADGRLVEHVERARQPAAELRAEAEPLHLAARERAARAGRARGSRGPPAATNVEPSQELGVRALRDERAAVDEAPGLDAREGARHRAGRHLRVRLAEHAHAARDGAEARPGARAARLVRALVLLEGRRAALDARALARLAAPLLGVEREPPRVELRHARRRSAGRCGPSRASSRSSAGVGPGRALRDAHGPARPTRARDRTWRDRARASLP